MPDQSPLQCLLKSLIGAFVLVSMLVPGDAVVLAAGWICHVEVPYATQVGAKLKTGHFVLTLQPEGNNYQIVDAVELPRAAL